MANRKALLKKIRASIGFQKSYELTEFIKDGGHFYLILSVEENDYTKEEIATLIFDAEYFCEEVIRMASKAFGIGLAVEEFHYLEGESVNFEIVAQEELIEMTDETDEGEEEL